jgi:GxxExxY protein
MSAGNARCPAMSMTPTQTCSGSQQADLSRGGAGACWAMPTEEHDPLTQRIIGGAIEVHRTLGPGLLESAYVEALTVELAEGGLRCARQVRVPLTYKGRHLGEYRLDLLVEDAVVVEVKAVERFDPVHEAQLLTYLRLSGKGVGLLINFNRRLLREGIKRLVMG